MKTADVYNLFFSPGEVTEIRAYGLRGKNKGWEGFAGGSGVVFGYFDNAEQFGAAAAALETAGAPGIYFTLNPAVPDLLARAANRLKSATAKSPQTSDKDILCIRWLPIDLDPVRPSGISSTDEELQLAVKLRNKIARWLKDEAGFVEGIPAISGNGAHYLLRLPDLENSDDNKQLVKQLLSAIAEKFKNPQVDIDLAVFNPSRIWKVYGTTARKGDHIANRPHRKSYISKKFMEN